MKWTTFSVTVNSKEKDRFEKLCAEAGISPSEAVEQYIDQAFLKKFCLFRRKEKTESY